MRLRVSLAALVPCSVLLLAGFASPAPLAAQAECIALEVNGTAVLPPAQCEYVSPQQLHVILDGLPPGTTLLLRPEHRYFVCGGGGVAAAKEDGTKAAVPPSGPCSVTTGGSLGGEVETFDSDVRLNISGTGLLAGYNRTVVMKARVETHTGPRNPGDPVQSFATKINRLDGVIVGDPDFAFLKISAGDANGFPSPGQTTLTQIDSNHFRVDSDFNVSYSISFEGAAGSPFEGFGGTTEGTVRMQAKKDPEVAGGCGETIRCSTVYEPVVCSNGQTYRNKCFALLDCETNCFASSTTVR